MAANSGMQARFRYGDVTATVPYTPSGADVNAGDVVVVAGLNLVATRKILDGELGSLNANGGVYECVGDAAIAAGTLVYWDNTNNKVTTTAGSSKKFGFTITACSADDATCDVMHQPLD